MSEEIETQTEQQINDKELDKYITILKSTNKLSNDFELESATPVERAELLGKYHNWITQGKPAPTMPEQKPEKKQCLRVYRTKVYGKEYIYYRALGEVVPIGVKQHPVYHKYQDEKGETQEDKTTIVDWSREYTNPYTEAKCKKLIERCLNESPKPKFAIVHAERTFECAPDSFTEDFDTLVKRAAAGDPI